MDRVKVIWNSTKHAYCMTNGIRTVWCDPDEYNETYWELYDELDN